MKKIAPVLLFVSAAGCSSITHELQPHRLWRWNYQEAPNRTEDALFSIDDPKIPAMSNEEPAAESSTESAVTSDSKNHE
jgi:hypothetical protein